MMPSEMMAHQDQKLTAVILPFEPRFSPMSGLCTLKTHRLSTAAQIIAKYLQISQVGSLVFIDPFHFLNKSELMKAPLQDEFLNKIIRFQNEGCRFEDNSRQKINISSRNALPVEDGLLLRHISTKTNSNNWERRLKEIGVAIRSAINRSTRFMPAFVMLGREFRYSCDNWIGKEILKERLIKVEGKRHNPREEILFFVVRKLSSSLSERPNACREERDSPFRWDNLIVLKPVQVLATFLWLENFRKEKRVLSCVKTSKNPESPPKVPPFAPTTSKLKESRVSSPECRSSSSAVAPSP
ncbi:unnamed protein product [Orchesella dallaii]|uniref:Uncharacterized protein n=1 Tax=Orchesella dallaii TaxID=48710 RepID=A0ABP1SAR7_9HEXA